MIFSRAQSGFTLIELGLVLTIIAILSSVALPTYRDFIDKARLAELQLRVDSMRTAMASAYQSGDRSMLAMGVGGPGEIPPVLANVPLGDTMTYPGLQMMLMSSSQQFGQFDAGTPRPYLLLGATGKDSDEARILRNFSEIYPSDRFAWWAPSTVMVIPLLDDGMLGVASNSSAPSPGSSTPSSGTVSSATTGSSTTNAGNQGTVGAVPGPTDSGPAPVTTPAVIPAPVTRPPVTQPPVAATINTCVHPGRGHAWGRCGGKP